MAQRRWSLLRSPSSRDSRLSSRLLAAIPSDILACSHRTAPHAGRWSPLRGLGPAHPAPAPRGLAAPVAAPATLPLPPTDLAKPANKSRYIPWAQLLRKTFGFELLCSKCQAPLRLIALIKTEDIARKILPATHLPTEVPELHPARPPPRAAGGGDDWVN